jgi:glutathionylspermidine synthase
MERQVIQPRPNWQGRCEEVGFDFHSKDGPYWNEAACYSFTEREIEVLESATQDLHGLCVKAVDHVVRQNRFGELGIPEPYAGLCRKSWERQDFSLYGRFDLVFDGRNPPKMLEYNADTPTALLEAAVVQWVWLEDTHPSADQFNSLHERLLEGFKKLADGTPLYLSCAQGSLEDLRTTEYLQDLASQAGLVTRFSYIEEVGWNGQAFVDTQERPIYRMFKLYPWEWMFRDEFGQHMLLEPWYLVEPPWKLILSSKGILPILWELFPGHPNLLPAFFDANRLHGPKVRKPRFSREGTNVTIESLGIDTAGPYSDEGWIYQALANIPQFDGQYPVIGSWIIEDEAAGMGIREDSSPVTQNMSRFVPHWF